MPTYTLADVVAKLRYADPANPKPEEVAFRRRFLELFPTTEADILSFQINPKCDCQGRIMQAVWNDQRRVADHASLLFGDDSAIVEVSRSLIGEVYVLDSDANYKDFMTRVVQLGHQYRGIAVMPLDGKLKLYFY